MRFSQCLKTTVLAGVVFVSAACTGGARDETSRDAGTALSSTRAGADKALDATRVVAGEVADKSKEVALEAGAAMSDGWITTKVKAKFADETVLKGSDIHVDTTDHVVLLKGTVPSEAARARALAIAGGTEGVTRVVNRLVAQ